jgi:hypothetical protein
VSPDRAEQNLDLDQDQDLARAERISMRRTTRNLVRNPAFWYTAGLVLAWPVEALLSPDQLGRLAAWSSTNLTNLRPSGHPLRALVFSAFVPEDSIGLWPFLALSVFAVVSALGARRAVALLAFVHIGVTLVTETLVWWRVHHGSLPITDEHTLDTGPSYLVVAAMVVAAGTARQVWLRPLWAVILIVIAPSLLAGIGDGDYTAIGHILAVSIGLVVVTGLRIQQSRQQRQIHYPGPSPSIQETV